MTSEAAPVRAFTQIHHDVLHVGTPDESAELYDTWAEGYDAEVLGKGMTGPQSVLSKWNDVARPSLAGNLVFDAGCGTGIVGDLFKQNIPELEIVGGDYSMKMLEMARRKGSYTMLMRVNLKEQLPFIDNYFDSIVSSGTFLDGHCGPECVAEMARILKPGSYFVGTVRTEYFAKTEELWDKEWHDAGCEIVEAVPMPYFQEIEGTVLVARKR